jgi:hypothetical protein
VLLLFTPPCLGFQAHSDNRYRPGHDPSTALPDYAIHKPLLTVLGCVRAIDVQGLEDSEGKALRCKVLFNLNMPWKPSN